MISEYKTNDKFPPGFLFVPWFLNGHPVSSSLGPPFLVQLKSLAPSPGRWNLSIKMQMSVFVVFFFPDTFLLQPTQKPATLQMATLKPPP